jgi:tRNA modification GTPase
MLEFPRLQRLSSFYRVPKRGKFSSMKSFLNNTSDTIVALSTPRGFSGIGVIRMSGPASEKILMRIFEPMGRRNHFPDRVAVYGRVVDPAGHNALDDGIAVLMKGPRSYTGDDMAELSLHGSPTVLDMVMSAIISQGVRPAGRGEFSLRAFLSGRIDLVQAEAVIDLIEAPSPVAVAEARSRLDRIPSKEIGAISDTLKDLLAELEAHIDFDEDDEHPPPDTLPGLRKVLRRVEELIRIGQYGRLRREGIRVVIAGKPNVGKSTLFNRLLRTDRAIVTPYPGTTRDTLEDRILLGGVAFGLYDTAGLRDNPDPVEKEGIRRAEQKIAEADFVIAVLDGSGPLDRNDARVLEACREKEALLVLNKADLGVALDANAPELGPKGRLRTAISAKTGQGLEGLERLIAAKGEEIAGASNISERGSLSERGLLLMEAVHIRTRNLIDNFDQGLAMGPEITSLEVSGILELLKEITGERVEEGILERIFERFCVGK